MRFFILSSCLVACCLFLASLGFWQLNRGEQKDQRASLFEKRTAIDLRRLRDAPLPQEVGKLLWTRIEAPGQYLKERVFLDNRTKKSRAGYDVFAPFQTDNGPLFLVCLGWVPSDGERSRLPIIPPMEQEEKVLGLLSEVPFSGLDFGKAGSKLESMGGANYRIQKLDLDVLAEDFGEGIFPLILYSESIWPGLMSNIPNFDANVAHKHYAYALQWFTMAAILALIGSANLWRSHRNG